MPMTMHKRPVNWMAVLATAVVFAGTVQAEAAPGGEPVAAPSRTIEWPAFPVPPEAGAPAGRVVAQSQITAGPLQGPLNPGAAGQNPKRSRPSHRRRLARRSAPVLLAAPLVPVVPVYVYPPPVVYRPVVPVYAFRPFYRPFFYRPFVYRPYVFYRPYPFRPYFYGRVGY